MAKYRNFKDRLDFNLSTVVEFETYKKVVELATDNEVSNSEMVRILLRKAVSEDE